MLVSTLTAGEPVDQAIRIALTPPPKLKNPHHSELLLPSKLRRIGFSSVKLSALRNGFADQLEMMVCATTSPPGRPARSWMLLSVCEPLSDPEIDQVQLMPSVDSACQTLWKSTVFETSANRCHLVAPLTVAWKVWPGP